MFPDLQLHPNQTFLGSKRVRPALRKSIIVLLYTHLFRAAILQNFPCMFSFSSCQDQHFAAIHFTRTSATFPNKWH